MHHFPRYSRIALPNTPPGSATHLLGLPRSVWLITTRFIQFEEVMHSERFEEKYRDYQARARRWL